MNELFAIDELIMMAVILFASFWLFLFNYRTDNKEKYEGFYNEFGRLLKEGVYQEFEHKEALTDLLRFKSYCRK